MTKFQFRLQTLMRVRESHRDEKRGRLAEAYQAEAILTEQQEEVQQELQQLQDFQRQTLQSNQTNVNQLLEIQRHQLLLLTQQKTMRKQSEILAEEIERRRQSLVEADREVRVLDKLQQRQKKQFQLDRETKEAKELDDISQRIRIHSREPGDQSWDESVEEQVNS